MGMMSIGRALSYLAAQAPDALSIAHETKGCTAASGARWKSAQSLARE